MAEEIYTVTVPDLPAIAQVTGDEQIAVYRDNRLGRIAQSSLRGTRTLSGATTPPTEPSVLLALMPILGDRWRNTATGDEWKITALSPVTWTFDGNIKGADGVSDIPGPPGAPGTKGPKGDDGKLTLSPALAAISADTAVVSVGSSGCIPANPLDLSHQGRVLGVVHQAVPSGGTAVIQLAGALDGATGSFLAGDAIFIASGGRLTNIAPTMGWRQQIGVAASTSRIVINLGPAYVIPEAATPVFATPTGGASLFVPRSGGDMTGQLGIRDQSTITSDNDATLQIETLSRPNAYSRKQIISSANVGDGNDTVLRAIRPVDNAVQDFIFKSGEAGKVWTSGNLNPALLAPKDNPVFTGKVSAPSYYFTEQMRLDATYDPTSMDSRIDVRRATDKTTTFADMYFYKDTSAVNDIGAGFGGVSAQLKLYNKIGSTDISQWNVISSIEVTGAGAGQHVAGYFQAFRRSNNACFVMCAEGRDFVASPTAGMAAFELDMMGQGHCESGQRVAFDVVFGSAVQYGAGENVVSEGVSVSPVHGQSSWVPGTTNGFETSANTGSVVLLNALRVKGNVVTGLNLVEMNANFNYQGTQARGVYHPNGLLDVWAQGGQIGFTNQALTVIMPTGGLLAGGNLPSTADGFILVNVGNLGMKKIPLLAI